ncbi:hypothetical protein [Psychroserpens algicola]|uniref:Uncharacterized protein n=1 Tax=Psychroserpens algicola TaxID=1719034 RepID=A0ABT0HA10_9FLAO|nr:hypothetical protein [Psychroserpens algicola]MCK8481214.1 hypothetical protein [Psychroserpens algicola]
MNDFLYQNRSFVTKSFEILAAILGSWYLKKTKNQNLKVFIYYLWLVVIVEVLGYYKHILQNNYDYNWFIAWKNSVLCQNTWLFNIYTFLKIGLLGVFYSSLLSKPSFKLIIRGIIVIYSIFSIIYYTSTDAFFVMGLPFDDILGAVIIFIYIMFYFTELMNSEYILQYYKLPSFYISVALLLWHLCTTPLFIYNSYFRAFNTEFVNFRTLLLLYINIFTYSCFAFGFWYSLKKSKK